MFEPHSTPVALVRVGASEAERTEARCRLRVELTRDWPFPKDMSRLRNLLPQAFNTSERSLYLGIYQGHPHCDAPMDQKQRETHAAILHLLCNDACRTFLPQFHYAQMLPIRQEIAPAMRPYVGNHVKLNFRLASASTDAQNVTGIGMRGLNVTGTLEVRMPGRAVLLLLPRGDYGPSGNVLDVHEEHTVRGHERALCYRTHATPTQAPGEATILDAQFEPTIVVSSADEYSQNKGVLADVLSNDGRDLDFVTRNRGSRGVLVMLRGNLTYRVKLRNSDFVFAAIESPHRAMQVSWDRAAGIDQPVMRAGFFEKSLLWTGDHPTQLPWDDRRLYDEAYRMLFPTGDFNYRDPVLLESIRRSRQQREDRADPSRYPYLDPADLVLTTGGMALLFGRDRLVMRRDRSPHRERGVLVLFPQTNTINDAFPVGRLVPIAPRTMQRHMSEVPYRYERYTESQPNEYAAVCGDANTVLEREKALDAYFGPAVLSFLAFAPNVDTEPVAAPIVATAVSEAKLDEAALMPPPARRASPVRTEVDTEMLPPVEPDLVVPPAAPQTVESVPDASEPAVDSMIVDVPEPSEPAGNSIVLEISEPVDEDAEPLVPLLQLPDASTAAETRPASDSGSGPVTPRRKKLGKSGARRRSAGAAPRSHVTRARAKSEGLHLPSIFDAPSPPVFNAHSRLASPNVPSQVLPVPLFVEPGVSTRDAFLTLRAELQAVMKERNPVPIELNRYFDDFAIPGGEEAPAEAPAPATPQKGVKRPRDDAAAAEPPTEPVTKRARTAQPTLPPAPDQTAVRSVPAPLTVAPRAVPRPDAAPSSYLTQANMDLIMSMRFTAPARRAPVSAVQSIPVTTLQPVVPPRVNQQDLLDDPELWGLGGAAEQRQMTPQPDPYQESLFENLLFNDSAAVEASQSFPSAPAGDLRVDDSVLAFDAFS